MSIAVTARVFGNFHEDSEASDRLVLILLADAAHDDGICWPSQAYIAERLRLGERTVSRSLAALEKRGEIEMRKVSRGRSRINVYRVTAAPLDPIYDRLPFTITEPFTTGQDGVSSADDQPGATATTRQERPNPDSSPSSLTVTSNRKDPSAAEPPVMPALPRVDGRDLPLDALAEVCGIDPANRTRMREAASALNGTKRDDGIKQMFWIEYQRWVAENAVGDDTAVSPLVLTEGLVAMIHRKAQLYRDRFPLIELTPSALRKWWLDLEKPRQGAGVTGDDLRRGTA